MSVSPSACLVWLVPLLVIHQASGNGPAAETYAARDTLNPLRDDIPDAQACLDALSWRPGDFDVVCLPAEGKPYQKLVSFPSPRPSGDEVNDRVTLEWYAARNKQDQAYPGPGEVTRAPAVVVIHESGSRMEAGRTFARGLCKHGLHTFLIHLPYYGERRRDGKRPESLDFTATMRQGIADARRARDAVAAIPDVDARYIALQGTSLGGFVGTTAAALDARYDGVFIMLAGADLYDIVQSGQKDTAKLREQLQKAGYDGEQMKQLLSLVEPLRIAHRLDPTKTWLYNSLQDDVVPIKNARLLASAAGLERSHQVELPGDHYSVVLYFPVILEHVGRQIREASIAN